MFLSLRMHARHWSNPAGAMCSFRRPRPPTEPDWCGGRRRDRTEPRGAVAMAGLAGNARSAIGELFGAPPVAGEAPTPCRLACLAPCPEGCLGGLPRRGAGVEGCLAGDRTLQRPGFQRHHTQRRQVRPLQRRLDAAGTFAACARPGVAPALVTIHGFVRSEDDWLVLE